MSEHGRVLDLYVGGEADEGAAGAGGAPTDPRPDAAVPGGKVTAPSAGGAREDWLAALWDGFPRAIRERYTPRAVIGEGGMGVVLEAEDRELRRVVAIKGVRDPRGITAEARVRHVREARISARLTHPNIVPVFDTWTDSRGNRWCSMLRVPGDTPTLSRWLAAQDPREGPEQRLNRTTQVFLQVCRAITYAHGQGVLHRDIKPENVLLGPTGEALVADWGVAVTHDEASTGEVVGTVGYSAPEQLGLSGKARADVRSDVYALGVLLCELIAGGPALERVLKARGSPADALPAHTPREVAALARRATAHEPEARFASVTALSGAMEAYLAGGLVEGLSYTPAERVAKWVRAHPVLVAVVLAVVALGWQRQSAQEAAHRQEQRATAERLRLERAKAAEEARLGRETERKLATSEANFAEAAFRANQLGLARHHAALAVQARERAKPLVAPARPDASALVFDVPQPDRLVWACTLEQPAEVALFTPDDRAIIAGSRFVSLWRFPMDGGPFHGARPEQKLVWGLAVSPEAGLAATGGASGDVQLLDLDDGRPVRMLGAHEQPLWALSFAPGGQRLASGSFDQTVRVWDTSPSPARDAAGKAAGGSDAAGRDGGRVDVAGGPPAARPALRARSGQPAPPLVLRGHTSQVWCVTWSPDGKWIASGGSSPDDLRVWDARTGRQMCALKAPGQILGVAFDPTGELLAVGSGTRGVPVYRWRESKVAWNAPVSSTVLSVRFSAQGLLATGGQDNVVRLWDPPQAGAAASERLALNGHGHWVSMVSFTNNGDFLVSAAQDRTVRLWDVRADRPRPFGTIAPPVDFVQWSPDGTRLFTRDNQAIRAFTPADGRQTAAIPTADSRPVGMHFDAQGNGAAVVSIGDQLSLQRYRAIAPAGAPEPLCPGSPQSVAAFDPQARIVAVITPKGSGGAWSLDPPERLRTIQASDITARSLAIDAQATRIAVGGTDTKIRIFHLDGRPDRVLTGHTEAVTGLAFSRDGRQLASGGQDFKLRVWDLATGRSRIVGDHVTDHVWSVCFDADASMVAGGGPGGQIYLWDTTTPEMTLRDSFRSPSASISTIALSPDGRYLASGGDTLPSVLDLAAWHASKSRTEEIAHASLFVTQGAEERLLPRPAQDQHPIRLPR